MTTPYNSVENFEHFKVSYSYPASDILHLVCQETIKQLFPDSGNIGNCRTQDILKLTAIFQRNRIAVKENRSQLPRQTKLYAADKLVTYVPFHDYDPKTALVDMHRYLSLLSEALRSFWEEGTALDHQFRNKWYSGLNNLNEIYERARRNCDPNLQIERYDVAFLLKHCQNILISIEDSYSVTDKAIEAGGHVVKSALQGYGGQYYDAGTSLRSY